MTRIEGNLAREPFLNRKVPFAIAGALVALALLATGLNLTLFLMRGGEYRTYHAKRKAQQERLNELERTLERERRLLEGREVDEYAAEAAFVGELLDRKRFSWTLFLDRLEDEKPFGVMMTDVSPRVAGEGGIQVSLRGAANARPELLKLEENLLKSRFFRNPELESEDRDPTNPWIRFTLNAEYLPEGRP